MAKYRRAISLSLRQLELLVLVPFGVFSVLAAVALFWVPTIMREATESAIRAGGHIQLCKELEVKLYEYERAIRGSTGSSAVQGRKEIEQLLQGWRAREWSSSTPQLLQSTEMKVSRFLAAPNDGSLQTALDGLEAVSAASEERAMLEGHKAERWDRIGDVLGGLIAFFLMCAIAFGVWGFNTLFYYPMLHLQESILRYTAGEKDCRPDKEGILELRRISTVFSEMAEMLARKEAQELEFLAGVAHDIRTPLTALKIASDLYHREPGKVTVEQSQRFMGLVSSQIGRMDRLVADLLDATRIQAGHLNLKLEIREIRALAAECVDLWRGVSPTHRLELSLPKNAVFSRIDPTYFSRVLNNLLSNSIKYSPKGGTIQILIARAKGGIELSFADKGIGISPEELSQIFEPFRRATSARHEKIPGIGLGLAVAKKIIELHQGRIAVESTLGQGTVFRIWLPEAEPLGDRSQIKAA